jgi:hypothetical protein
MRRMLAVVVVVPMLLAAEEKPNALTTKEIADGWLMLFDGETMFGWEIHGEAKVEKGVLVLGGTRATTARLTSEFLSYDIRAWVEVEGKEPAEVRAGDSRFKRAKAAGELSSRIAIAGEIPAGTIRPVTPIELSLPAGTTARVSRAVLQPLGMGQLFNGKDLTGWKMFKGNPRQEKSKWAVSKEGWLNLKDGPGDLQTEKLYDDFVLQLECKSNGKHLNSGVFFRAIPGKYQQGYEAQIHNNFTADPPRKYQVEEYDPKTHKPLGKKVVQSAAVDYGTGAIYRRVPARKGIAKDGEWFTMTVVARGRHIATWVNGVQVVDWADNRPAKENAREGYREAAGAISLQGHDPTTDLSFRNIRIAKLPR